MKKSNNKFKLNAKSGENKNNKKLTYKLEFELNSLPSKIKNLEDDINTLIKNFLIQIYI